MGVRRQRSLVLSLVLVLACFTQYLPSAHGEQGRLSKESHALTSQVIDHHFDTPFNGLSETFLTEDKRRAFIGKRANSKLDEKRRAFIGKRDEEINEEKRRAFIGKRDDIEEEKRRAFIGKRFDSEVEKRRAFIGKRDHLKDLEDYYFSIHGLSGLEKEKRRAFIGKRNYKGEEKRRAFIGKRLAGAEENLSQYLKYNEAIAKGSSKEAIRSKEEVIGKRDSSFENDDEFYNEINSEPSYVNQLEKRRAFIGKRFLQPMELSNEDLELVMTEDKEKRRPFIG